MAVRNLPLRAGGLSNAWQVADQSARSMTSVTSVSMAGALAQAVAATNKQIPGMLRALGDLFSRPLEDAGRRTEMHRQVGVLAQRSVLSSYDQQVVAREGPGSRTHYRIGRNRLAGGVLRRAMARSDFFEATPDGLNFGNTSMLDHEAAHWHRLAFGAGEVGQGGHAAFEVTWGNLVVGALGFEEPASPAFRMPLGIWLDFEYSGPPRSARYMARMSSRGGTFYPRGKALLINTVGIVGKPFFEAGFRRIAREFPRAYEEYYRELWAEFKETGAGPLADLTVKAVIPRPQTYGASAIR